MQLNKIKFQKSKTRLMEHSDTIHPDFSTVLVERVGFGKFFDESL